MKIWRKLFLGLGFLLILFLVWCIYWGITPNSLFLIVSPNEVTPVSPLYYIKIPRERLQSMFVFGDQDLSLWNFTLAKKRLEEAKILQRFNLNKAAQIQTGTALAFQQKGESYLNNLIDRIDTNYLIQFRNENQKLINNLNIE